MKTYIQPTTDIVLLSFQSQIMAASAAAWDSGDVEGGTEGIGGGD